MARKRHTPEQVVNLLRQVEVAVANGKTTGQACKEALITEQTYYRWRFVWCYVLTRERKVREKRRFLSIPYGMCLTTTVPPSGFHEQGLSVRP